MGKTLRMLQYDVPKSRTVLFKREQDSETEIGLQIDSSHSSSFHIIVDSKLKIVEEMPCYTHLLSLEICGTIRCRNFITFTDYHDTHMEVAIFKENTNYLIVEKNVDHVIVLDEKLNMIKLRYEGMYYQYFQR